MWKTKKKITFHENKIGGAHKLLDGMWKWLALIHQVWPVDL